jgi:hypothetical protein
MNLPSSQRECRDLQAHALQIPNSGRLLVSSCIARRVRSGGREVRKQYALPGIRGK